jgi:RNase adaptor protein for sRNA GlmZ degradation
VEHSFIPDSIVRELETQLRIRSEQLKRVAEIYKTATKHPDRYSTLWFSVLHDASNVVVIFRFQHINRRHPMSPDGWASMTSKYVHHFSMLD